MTTTYGVKEKKPVDFYKRTFAEGIDLINANLTSTGYRMVEMFSASAVFKDGFVYIPSVKEIAEFLGKKVSCIYDNLKRIREQFPRLQIISLRCAALVKRVDTEEKILPSKNLENIPINRNYFQEYVINSRKLENESLEPLPDKDSKIPQTIQTLHTPQTGEEEEKKNIEEKEVSSEELGVSDEEADDDVSASSQAAERIETVNNIVNGERKVLQPVVQNKYKTPQVLLKRLRMSGVKTSEQVLVKISEHHISQAYGAITHVENTRETINDATAVFLYQLPKQPVEKLGQRYSDENLEKAKRELAAIDKERSQGIKPIAEIIPNLQKIKEGLAAKAKGFGQKKTGLPVTN